MQAFYLSMQKPIRQNPLIFFFSLMNAFQKLLLSKHNITQNFVHTSNHRKQCQQTPRISTSKVFQMQFHQSTGMSSSIGNGERERERLTRISQERGCEQSTPVQVRSESFSNDLKYFIKNRTCILSSLKI